MKLGPHYLRSFIERTCGVWNLTKQQEKDGAAEVGGGSRNEVRF